jgi:hypothetical protein
MMGLDRPEVVTTHGHLMMASWPRLSQERCPDNYRRTLLSDLRFPAERSAQWRLDNCYWDQAVTNAAQLADLLSSADVPVVPPGA